MASDEAPKSVLVDFDGTIVEHRFPGIGDPLPGAFRVLKRLKEAGYQLVLWTCRENWSATQMHLEDAVVFCRENGIEFDAVNESIPNMWGPSRKPLCTVHVDDRNLGGFPGWDVVERMLLGDAE